MKRDIITVSVLFLAIILIALWFSSTPSYVPYSESILRSHPKYEPFSTLAYSTSSNNAAIDSSVSDYEINPSSGAKAVSGFSGAGVFNTPDVAIGEKIDIYSGAKGSLSTPGYGYYNSQGPLVLDNKMKDLLQTRGGNASGASSVIGGSPA